MNIIVTGGAGFLGSHLCEYLLEKNNNVWCLDNLSTGSENNIKYLENRPDFKFFRHDVREPYGGPDIDRVYNLACYASPKAYRADPMGTISTSYKGMLNALRIGCRVLQASTSEVYGDPMFPVQDEGYWGNVNCYGPRACYDEGKRIAETLCYENRDKIEVRIARIFNTYGPRMANEDGRVVPEFICNAFEGKPLVVNGDGKQTRSFCYVDDMIRGLEVLMESNIDTPVNLGNPIEQEVLSLAYQIIAYTKSDSDIVFGPAVQDDPRRRRPNIMKAKELLGWEPRISTEQGLPETIEYFKQRVLSGV